MLAGDTAAKMRKLGKELKALAGRTRLPLHAAAAIFLRYDSDRIDKMRAIITGGLHPASCLPAWPASELHRLHAAGHSTCICRSSGCQQRSSAY